MAYRIMAYQETGEEVCVSDGHTQEEAYTLIDKAQEDHPEWYRFSVEYMKTNEDYIKEQQRMEDEGWLDDEDY
jgi:hypothetical protein